MKADSLFFALYGQIAGVIQRKAGRLSLSYLPEYIQLEGATPLSVSMPVGTAAYTNRLVEAYLRGLLPDHEGVRQRWARRFGLKDRDTFGLIAAIGLDCAGGAVFASEDEIEHALERPGRIEPLSEAEIAAKLRLLREDETAWQDETEDAHWSLAGGQGKFTLAEHGQGWGLPMDGAASTHIVKPGIGRLPGQALAEHVSMRALGLAGIPVADTSYREFEDQPAIIIRRFDRTITKGQVTRIHQEDMCQALGIDPAKKYASQGGPGAVVIAGVIDDLCRDDSVERFAKAVIANYLLGAPDAHAKNYALLHIGRTSSLAPLYDVCTGFLTAEQNFPKAAMSIGGENRFGSLKLTHIKRFATQLGLDADEILEWSSNCSAVLLAAFEQALGEIPGAETEKLRGTVMPQLTALCRSLGG